MPDTLTAGTWFAGRFELQSTLGRGGMATVYRAWDHLTQRPCAIKILSEALSEDEQFRQRFRQEASAARGLTHPSIVRVDDWGEAGARHYIVMEYVAGGSLRDLLRRRGRLPQALALRIAAEVADALAHAHARGVVHRDIKPENLLLDEEARIKVADFGIARTVDAASLTRTGIVMGSARYLSPEQARGGSAEPRSDLYALGVVLFEMLAGRVPFDGDSAVAIAVQHVHERPPRIQQLRADVAASVAACVERLLAKHKQDRYPTAAALAEDLRRHATAYPGGLEDPHSVSAIPAPRPSPAADPEIETMRLDLQTRAEPAISRTEPLTVGGVGGAAGATAALPGADAASVESPEAAYIGRPGAAHIERPGADRIPREDGPSAPRRRPADLRPAAFVAVLLALAVAVGTQGYRFGRPVVVVPSLVGRSVTDASRTVQTLGLRLIVAARRQDAKVPAGMIIIQDPPGGGRAGKDSVVGVVVSQGSGIVPDLRGLPFDDAARRLVEAAGLHLRRIGVIGGEHGEDAAVGATIVAQLEAPGTHLPPDSTVDVMLVATVKKGPDKPVPAVVPAPEREHDEGHEKN